jgi:hypothetical protein
VQFDEGDISVNWENPLLPELNKNRVASDMQSFDRQSAKIFEKYFHSCQIFLGHHWSWDEPSFYLTSHLFKGLDA